MNELKMLYIAPEAELILFMPMEGIANDFWAVYGARSSNDEYDGPSGPGIGVGGADSEEDGDDPTPFG